MEIVATVRLWLGVATVLYGVSWAAWVCGRRRIAGECLAAGWIVNIGVFILNWMVAQGIPLGTIYHVFVAIAGLFPLVYLLVSSRLGTPSLGAYFAAPSCLCCAAGMAMAGGVLWQRGDALMSPWFVPHIASYLLSYAFAALAFSFTLAGWRLQSTGRDGSRHALLSSVMLRIALPFMTVGLGLGAVWADEAWGAVWSWDPKETGALITYLLYLAWFHCWVTGRSQRVCDRLQMAGFFSLLITFLVIGLIPLFSHHGFR